MADPRRWLESDDLTSLERELLLGERDEQPDPALQHEVWQAVLGGLPPIGGGGGVQPAGGGAEAGATGAAVGAGAVAKLSGVAIVKPFVIGLLSGGVAMTAVELASDAPRPGPRQGQSVPAAIASAPIATVAEPAPEAALEPTAPRRPHPIASAPASASAPAAEPPIESTLRAERDALTRARAALQSGQAGEALTILESARRTIERPMLGQEREVVTIRALAAAGRAEEARSRARQFLAAFPDSPHAAVVRRFSELGP
jgi:hypothetical protein